MNRKFELILKQVFDIIVALLSLIILTIPFLFIAIAIRFSSKGPVFFKQLRPGLGGKSFTIYKFRTLMDKRDKNGNLLSDKERLTSSGRFLRKTSIDELPEIFNVIKGDMSIVGPRPLLMQYLERYTSEQARRHEVKPGITGWAQVNGRNAISWEDKFKLDVWYVDNMSFLLDIKIIFLTIWKILKCEGINQPGQATAEEFKSVIRKL